MADVNLIIRTADKARKAEITVATTQTGADVIQAALDNWSLPRDTDYTLVNTSKTPPETLSPAATLEKAGVENGNVLEVQPVLVAGA